MIGLSAARKSTGWRAVVLSVTGMAVWGLDAGEKVVIISPHNAAIRFEFGEGFARWTERRFGERVGVEWRDLGGTTDDLRFVQSEFQSKPEGIGIDCFFGGGPEPVLLLSDKGFCLRHEPAPEVLNPIPRQFNGIEVYDKDYEWFGAALSSFGILENLRVQALAGLPMVKSWEGLADPRLYGWVGAGDPRNSGTMNTMFETILQAYGWERGWQVITELAGNVRMFDRISSTTAKGVTLGETAYALAIDFYAFTQIAYAGRTNLTFVLPEDFTSISPDGLAVLKGAPHERWARRFVEFVLSEEGQKLWFLPKGHAEGPRRFSIERMSVRPDFYARYKGISNIEFSPFDLKQSFVYDAKLGRARREILPALIGAFLVDTHTELRQAWRTLIQEKMPEAKRGQFGRMPLTGADALALAGGAWKDPAVRNQKKIEWQTFAQEKYRRLARSQAGRQGGAKQRIDLAETDPR